MKFSIFDSIKDIIPKLYDLSWYEIKEVFANFEDTDSKENVALFSPAVFADKRSKQDVTEIHFLVFDIDGENGITQSELEDIKNRLSAYEYIIYSSYSHYKVYPNFKGRIIIPFSKPVTDIKLFDSIWQQFATLIKSGVDKACKDPSRIYYIPSKPTDFFEHVYYTNVGDYISIPTQPTQPTQSTHTDIQDIKPVPLDTKELKKYINKLKASNDMETRQIGNRLLQVTRGEPYEKKGGRDNTTFQLICAIYKKFPDVDPYHIKILFEPSLQLMYLDDSDKIDVLYKAKRIRENALKDIQYKIQVSIGKRENLIKSCFMGYNDRNYCYTDDELQKFADINECTIDELYRQIIVQKHTNYYVLTPRGYHMYTLEELKNNFRELLSPFAKIDLLDLKSGEYLENFKEILKEHCTVANNIVYDLTIECSRYEYYTKTLYLQHCPVIKYKAEYSLEVDKYLKILAGDDYEQLKKWLAYLLDLDKPLCALFLQGAKSTGKSFLASELSRFWTNSGATKASTVMTDDFNSDIIKCPFIVADEYIPNPKNAVELTAKLRELIQARTHKLNEKFQKLVDVRGCLRFLIASNNNQILNLRGDLSDHDLKAVNERFFYIEVDPLASEYLQKIDTYAWVQNNTIQKHVMYLIENRVKEDKLPRFILSQSNTKFYKILSVKSGYRSELLYIFSNFIKNSSRNLPALYVKNCQLYCKTDEIMDLWDSYCFDRLNTHKPRDLRSLTIVIKNLSTNSERVMNMIYCINLEQIRNYLHETYYMSLDEFHEKLKKLNEST